MLMLLLAGCIGGPTLTLIATSSWRGRHDGAARAHAWSAGAQLGWSAGTRGHSAPDRVEGNAMDPRPQHASATAPPCAFDSTCSWEREARSAALRAGDAAEGEQP
jgi:hypothetical protein